MNNKIKLEVECLPFFKGLDLPKYSTTRSAGLDLASAEDTILKKGERKLVSTGLKMAIPSGYEGQIRPRSGLTLKKGILIPNSPGTIDADYRGEVKIIMWNLGDEDFEIKRGDRIAQLIVAPVVQTEIEVVEKLDVTQRNEGGFGHTGIK